MLDDPHFLFWQNYLTKDHRSPIEVAHLNPIKVFDSLSCDQNRETQV